VVAWGDDGAGGANVPTEISTDASEDAPAVVAIFSLADTFVAITQAHTGYIWGAVDHNFGPLPEVLSVAATATAFAGILSPLSVTAWSTGYGSDVEEAVPEEISFPSASPSAGGDPVLSVAATEHAFAAITASGVMYAWGDPEYGGEVSPAATDTLRGRKTIAVTATRRAFAALTADGSVVAWGDGAFGGDGVPEEASNPAPGGGVVAIAANDCSFAALLRIPAVAKPKMQVLQKDDDKLALRVDDEPNDATYFFVKYEGGVKVNSIVFDEATETLVVNGISRLRGEVYMDDRDVSLQRQLEGKLSHAEAGMVTQVGKVRLH